ncbi:MAG: triose-phosphate isomerase [Clostridia bacterium]|nr:triose-phosphate isomerase [Clostridia bacterium]MDD4386934.1 triose-phosphate isomerase [Clostridia bacterium]
MRKKIITGNWKMNYTVNEAEAFITSILESINTTEIDVVICPNFTALDRLSNLLDNKNVKLGAQNVSYETKGAYTGETSVDMLYALDVEYCIVGHSERRQILNETNEIVNLKAKKLLAKGINPIICVGETLTERNENKLYDVISNQVKNGLKDISSEDVKTKVVMAYEPIWAIGTGVTATTEQAEDMCKYIRNIVCEIYSESVANNLRIQYGGSVNPKNANEILNMENIDGALVGGASLTNDFVAIVNYQ